MVALPIATTLAADAADDRLRGVRAWLLMLILLVFAMVLVGGATRLTESGLSITEWNLVAGALPPFGESAWQEAFELYRQSPQYELLNQGMNLASFKNIYWWEWTHRELGRFIGLVYIAGFAWFAMRRTLRGRTLGAFAGMGLLLGLQGLVGWIMVASGLKPGMQAVEPVRLMLHLLLASLFFALIIAAYVRLGGALPEPARPAERRWGGVLVVLAFLQIALGALMAGHDAGLAYNTWPLMDGRLIPKGLGLLDPLWLNVVDNITAIQFNHRMGAYALAAAILAHVFVVRRAAAGVRGRAVLLTLLVLAQIGVGIATLLLVVPIGLALLHQGLALILLLVLAWNASVLAAGTDGTTAAT